MAEMNLTNKLYQLDVINRIEQTDWEKGNAAPFVVELDTTAVCDLACPGCISEDIIALGNRFKGDRLLEIGREMIECGVKSVILIGGGEPLAHPNVGDLINLLGDGGVHVGITTNGTFIHKHLAAISKHAKWTRVSMDAATESTFRVLRPTKGGNTSKWDTVVANMRLLAKHKTGKLGYSFLIQTPADGVGLDNIEEIYGAAVLARDIGCDYFEVKPTYQFREGINHALMKHPPETMRRAAAEIERIDSLETDTFKILRAINLKHSLDGVQVEQSKDYHMCPSTHLRTTVTPTGVFVCPYWRGKEHMKVGDLTKGSFKEMWDGALRKTVMARLDPSQDCNFHCLRHDTNEAAIAIKRRLLAGGEIPSVEEFDRFI